MITAMVNEITASIKKALKTLGLEEVSFSVEHPDDLGHGDYATNVALVSAKVAGKNPKEVAEEIVKALSEDKSLPIENIQIAGPGFINFHLSKDFFNKELDKIISDPKNFGKNKNLKGEKTIVEYTDANPFKEFHIGHVMSNTIGESLARVFEWNGAEVKRACYQGDVGLHVAKAVAHKIKGGKGWTSIKDIALSYAEGNKKYEEDKEFKNFVIETNKQIYSKENDEVNKIYDEGRKISLDYFEELYKKLGTKFDFYFFESTSGEFGKEIVKENIGKVFEESEGAVIFRGEKRDEKLHTRVFINKEGLPTYEAKELGLAKIKSDKYPYDRSVVITGNEINDYFRVLVAALSEIYPDLAEKTEHLSHGMMRLPSGKMSSRTGDVITAGSLIDEVSKKVIEKMKTGEKDFSGDKELVEAISVGAIKYSILKQTTGKDIIFDLETATSFEGDSGPYLQYTHARICSLLEKGKEVGLSPKFSSSEELSEVEKIIYRFPEIVARANEEKAPHHIATFLIQFSALFNTYYANNKVVDEENKEVSEHRLALAQSVGVVLKNGLEILGILAPQKM